MQIDEAVSFTFKQKLAEGGLRLTHVRSAIFEVLYHADKPMTIQSISKEVSSAHFVSIYRSIESMQRAGIVALVPQGFKSLFELSDFFRPHHHHATCKQCGKSTPVHDERIEQLMNKLTLEAGLVPTEHHFEMYGICAKCRELAGVKGAT